ncbi:MAG: hypothetical protein R3305_01610, partial [Gammaproteobacteria bacterium]|nr:hypothetical protein [Gammaproteobacteria bacterium]
MLVDWLDKTTLDVTLLIALVLVLRPFVRRWLGAAAAYWLWCLPLLRAVIVARPERPRIVVESLGPGTANFDPLAATALGSVPDVVPWASIWIAGASIWIAVKLFAWWRLHAALRAGALPIDVQAPPRYASL